MATTVIEFTTGKVGSGKSLRRCGHYLIKEFFNPDEPTDEYFWSNFPIQFDPWTDDYGVDHKGLFGEVKDLYGIEAGEVLDRVFVFPKEEVQSWMPVDGEEVRGPWNYFQEQDIDLSQTHVAIDEIHNFCPAGNAKAKRAWQTWLGEIRHEGATIEFLTQTPGKVNKAIQEAAEVRRQLVKNDLRRDPIFGILLDHWYNVGTVFGKQYRPSRWQLDLRQTVGTKWEISNQTPFWIDPKLFGVYKTNSESEKGGKSGKSTAPPFKRFGKLELLRWFLRKNWWRFIVNKTVPRAGFIIVLLVVMSQFPKIINYVTGKATGVEAVESNLTEEGETIVDVSPIIDEDTLLLIAEEISRRQTEDVVVGMVPDKVILANGQTVGIGDGLTIGGEQKKITGVNYETRTVNYVGGELVFVRDHGMQKRLAPEDDRIASIRERLRAGGDKSEIGKGQGRGDSGNSERR